jgi:putative flippase GtrA
MNRSPPRRAALPLRQVLSFAVVGAVGFAVDASVLIIGMRFGLGKDLGRVVSFLCAVTVTWALNRRFTFADASKGGLFYQWLRFAISQTGGAAVNLGAYFALVHVNPTVAAHPVIGVAVGSLLGMSANFLLARRYVFAVHSGNRT